MSLYPTNSATHSTQVGRLPTKAEKESKKDEIAVRLLQALGRVMLNYRIQVESPQQLDSSRSYRLTKAVEVTNGIPKPVYIGFCLESLYEISLEMQEALNGLNLNEIAEIKEFARRVEKVLEKPEYISSTGFAKTALPAMLAAEKVKNITESPFCLASIVDILNDQKAEFPQYFMADSPKDSSPVVNFFKRIFKA